MQTSDSYRKGIHIDWINKVLLYSTENYTQYLVINHNGKENVYAHIYMLVCMYRRIIL